jgi:HSP20 family molecular chaperone IbpA
LFTNTVSRYSGGHHELTKATPTTTLIREDFENLFDRPFGRGLAGQPSRVFETIWMPNLDFSENEKEYIVRVEAPGIPKDDLDVNVEGQILTISGRRNFEKEEQNEEYFWREPEQGRFRPHGAPAVGREPGQGGGLVQRRRHDDPAAQGGIGHEEPHSDQVTGAGRGVCSGRFSP